MSYLKLIFGGSGLRPRGSSDPEGGITPSVKRGYAKVHRDWGSFRKDPYLQYKERERWQIKGTGHLFYGFLR